MLIGHMIANDKNAGLDIALNPAWRKSVSHLVVINAYQDGIPRDQIKIVYDNITYNKIRELKDLDLSSGAYFNEVSHHLILLRERIEC
jgi:hypothetical protein